MAAIWSEGHAENSYCLFRPPYATINTMKTQNNKDKILQQVSFLIDTDSLEHITIREICSRAGVSIGSFYHHFSSKDDAIIQLFLSNADRAEPLVRNQFKASLEWDNLRSYIQFQIDSALSRPVERLKYIYTYNINRHGYPMDRFRSLVREILVRAQEKGQMNHRLTCDQVLDHLFTLILGNMVRYCIEDGDYDLESKLMSQVNNLISFIEKEETK